MPRDARAQEDPRRARADAAFQEGLRLHDRHEEAAALEKFKDAYAAYPSPNALFSIGREEHLLGRNVAALRHYREAMKNPLLSTANAELGRRYIKELEPAVGRLAIRAPQGAKVSVDGEIVPALVLGEALDVSPGMHAVEATTNGASVKKSANVTAGQIVELDLAPPAPTTLPPASTSTQTGPPVTSPSGVSSVIPPPAEPASSHPAGEYVVVGGLAVVGVASVIASFAFGSASQSNRDDASAAAANHACAEPASASCSEFHSKDDAADQDRKLSLVSGITGGALVIGAVATAVIFFALPKKNSTKLGRAMWLTPSVGSHAASLEAGLRF